MMSERRKSDWGASDGEVDSKFVYLKETPPEVRDQHESAEALRDFCEAAWSGIRMQRLEEVARSALAFQKDGYLITPKYDPFIDRHGNPWVHNWKIQKDGMSADGFGTVDEAFDYLEQLARLVPEGQESGFDDDL